MPPDEPASPQDAPALSSEADGPREDPWATPPEQTPPADGLPRVTTRLELPGEILSHEEDPLRYRAPVERVGPDARAESIARQFHEEYERLAPSFGYETRKETAVPWEDVPEQNRKLMIAVAAALLDRGAIA